MAFLYEKQGLPDKASPLLEEIVSSRERVQGRDHPDVAAALNNQAQFLESQVMGGRREKFSGNCVGCIHYVNGRSVKRFSVPCWGSHNNLRMVYFIHGTWRQNPCSV